MENINKNLKLFIPILLMVFMFGLSCKVPMKVAYTIPEAYTGQAKINMETMLQQGQELYKINCSRCHGIFTKGKDSIPNFSKTQIENYGTAALMDDPKNHAVMQKIRPYDLDMILQFLAFRKDNNKSAVK